MNTTDQLYKLLPKYITEIIIISETNHLLAVVALYNSENDREFNLNTTPLTTILKKIKRDWTKHWKIKFNK